MRHQDLDPIDRAAPAMHVDAQLLLRAQGPRGLGLKVAFIDVDGVLTDGALHFGEQGEAFKSFHVLDGQGLKLLEQGAIVPCVISGRDGAAVRARMRELKLAHVHLGVDDKLAVARDWLARIGSSWDEAAAIGDDWPDLPLLERAAFACAPPNSHPEVTARVHHVTRARGGAGAVREFCDILLTANGRYAQCLEAARRTTASEPVMDATTSSAAHGGQPP
jgi:3-deoxy-D-manno-octulosonate 8-phosphate phosphatase (KDO 8-P phosphatase)